MASFFGLCAALCVLYVESGSAHSSRSECEPEFQKITPECGVPNLEATETGSVLESPYTWQGKRPNSLRSCVWTVKTVPGSSIVLFLQEKAYGYFGCWPEYIRIYQGLQNQNYEDELYSTCFSKKYERIYTGSQEITVVIQVVDTFEDKKMIMRYYSLKNRKEDETNVPLNVVLSFEPINSCVNPTKTEERRSFTLTDANLVEGRNEVHVFLCVYPQNYINLKHLSSDPQKSLKNWGLEKNYQKYTLYSYRGKQQNNGNYTFTVAARNKLARIRFEIFFEYAPTVREERVPTFTKYRVGYTYYMKCSFSDDPFLNVSFFIYNAANFHFCLEDNLPPVDDWERLSSDFFNETINKGNVRYQPYYDCHKDFYVMTIKMVAKTSGCLVCWARNDHGYGSYLMPISVTGF